ncbi:MAG: helix-turn-helix domain-containing protein [Colwellia sp.]
MIEFYKKSAISFIGLMIITAVFVYFCMDRLNIRSQLFPKAKSSFLWHAQAESDTGQGEHSSATIIDDLFSLDVDFNIKDNTQYPYASVAIIFNDVNGEQQFIDLSQYHSLSFSVKCSPHNVLLFSAYTIDRNTVVGDLTTYRTPTSFFSCDEQWRNIEIDLTRLKIPQWWFDKYKLELSNQAYQLDKIARFSIGTTHRSPVNITGNVKINELTLKGRDWRYFYGLGTGLIIFWLIFLLYFFKQHSKALIIDLKNKYDKDRPLIAYQKLSLDSQKDKSKAAILRFLSTEYANAELNVDLAITELGVSRTKINDILKEELGFTFSAYLNKLRLTEAARLLTEKKEANIAEIAYSVGYKNVTYFNKLFKNEYGCTPKIFKNLQHNKVE